MANLEVKNPPEFTDKIYKTEREDLLTAELENSIKGSLLNNDVFLKQALDEEKERAEEAEDSVYQQATGYTDQKIADLIGGAPETLDTLKEVADAIQTNQDVSVALDAAIGKKANQTELDTHTGNNTIHITSTERTNWNAAKTHADSTHAMTDATKVEKSATNGNIKINGTETSVYTHPTTVGNKHIPSGGAFNQILRYNSNGTAKWDSEKDENVKQTISIANTDYRITFINNNDVEEIAGIRKSENLLFNPGNGDLYAKGYRRIDITGQALDINTLNLSAGTPNIMRYIEKTDGGCTNITNIPVAGKPFLLDVEIIRWASTTDYITIQTFRNASDYTHEYVRICNSGTWTAWQKRIFTDTNTTYSAATQSAAGLMSSTDKKKLDGIVEGANKVTVDSALSDSSTNPVQNKVVNSALTDKLSLANGGTVKKIIYTEGGTSVYNVQGTAGSAGYIKFAHITITGAYQNEPIIFELTSRGRGLSCILYLAFASVSHRKPGLGSFYYTGADYDCYVHVTATDYATFDLYVKKSEGYDRIDVVRYHKPTYMSGCTLTWKNDHASAVPDDAIKATYYGGSNMTGATASAAGKAGLVPAPAAGNQGEFLRGDGTWQTPTNTTYGVMTGAYATPTSSGGWMVGGGKSGLVPTPNTGDDFKYLKGDGTWATPVGFRNTGHKSSDGNTNKIGELFNNVYNNNASGDYSHAEGDGTTASGKTSHAEGFCSIAAGDYSHAEGCGSNRPNNVVITGTYDEIETGWKTNPINIAKGKYSHVEGNNCLAYGSSSHAEGSSTIARGIATHVEGTSTKAVNSYAHAEGRSVIAYGNSSHAEGVGSTTEAILDSGYDALVNGWKTTKCSVAFGSYSHVEGKDNIAYGEQSHAEGTLNIAKGSGSHVEGYNTTANSDYSHAEGGCTVAGGIYAHAEGYKTTTKSYQHAQGHYNKEMTAGNSTGTIGTAFIIGNGSSGSLSNAFRIDYNGTAYGLSNFQASGADYAEFLYEWYDGNENNEDRVGYFVTFKDKKLYKATSNDYIVGIISGNPSVVGNGDEDYYWRYERDEFSRFIMEDVMETEVIVNEETGETKTVETGNVIKNGRFKQNKDYDASKPYVERKYRKEWDYVGMLGVLPLRDDGSCIPGQFCKCNDEGIGTLAENMRDGQTFMVLERVNDHVVKVLLK